MDDVIFTGYSRNDSLIWKRDIIDQGKYLMSF